MSFGKRNPAQQILELLDSGNEPTLYYDEGSKPVSAEKKSHKQKSEWVRMRGGMRHARTVRMAERYPLQAKITLRKGTRTLRGDSLNISMLGLFVCTSENMFKENEHIHVVICPKGSTKNYKVVARVVRICSGHDSTQGYGLTFV